MRQNVNTGAFCLSSKHGTFSEAGLLIPLFGCSSVHGARMHMFKKQILQHRWAHATEQTTRSLWRALQPREAAVADAGRKRFRSRCIQRTWVPVTRGSSRSNSVSSEFGRGSSGSDSSTKIASPASETVRASDPVWCLPR